MPTEYSAPRREPELESSEQRNNPSNAATKGITLEWG